MLVHQGILVARLSEGLAGDANRGIGIGRDPSNTIVLLRPSVSRFHAKIINPRSGAWRISNRSITNPTTVNATPIGRHMPLRDQDVIGIGGLDLVFSTGRVATDDELMWSQTQSMERLARETHRPKPSLAGDAGGDAVDPVAMLAQASKTGRIDLISDDQAIAWIWIERGTITAMMADGDHGRADAMQVIPILAKAHVDRYEFWRDQRAESVQKLPSTMGVLMEVARIRDEVNHG